jgi:chemotaxis protein methyltransferase CheR
MSQAARQTRDPFDAIRDEVKALSGIHLTPAKRELVATRLSKRMRATGCATLEDYVALLATSGGSAERDELIRAITTNVTHFNREPHHFEHFASHAMPWMLRLLDGGQPVRIWSAGCSDGREPYTIAAFAIGVRPDLDRRDFQILATDIDTTILETARQGRYEPASADRLPVSLRERWFQIGSRGIEPADVLRRLVSFRQLNLISDWPMQRKYAAIFCRNTLIYFEQDLQANIMSGFRDRLLNGGFLYLGHSERLHGPAARHFRQVGVTTFQYMPKDGADLR